MSEVVIVAMFSLVGTVVGTLGGILTANRLSNYRIEQLEKRLDEYKALNDRVYKLETHDQVIEGKIDKIETLINEKLDALSHRQQSFITSVKEAVAGE